MAHELGKHLHEYMGWDGPVTHRQHLCWVEWRDFVSINQPSRDNYYQMQIACEQRRQYSKNPRSVKLEHFKLTFGKKTVVRGSNPSSQDDTGASVPKKTPQQERLDRIKQSWIGRMTKPIIVRQDGQVMETIEPPSVKAKRIREEALKKARANATNRKQPNKQPLKSAPETQDKPADGKQDGSNKRRTTRPTGRGRNQVRKDAGGSNPKDGDSG
jgi:hypothetical protein